MKVFMLGILIPLCEFSYLGTSGDNEVALFANILFFSSATALYFYPSICAMGHTSQTRLSIFKLNLLAGWTGVGWCLALYQALALPLASE
ncbi:MULTISPECIES: superinfection immunity protein [Pseudomonas]|uniref:superinfection immunity protein n=1 Tax=Pseudomonas TaxID=286 RepID=UPI0028776291|nr:MULTISPECIES: superinfection immunity protein [Pseudomonas]